MTAEQGDRIFWSTAVILPLAFGLVGIALVLRRRWGG